MGISSILKGHLNEALGLNKDISLTRLNICKRCPLMLDKFGGICNNRLWINPNTQELSIKELDGYKNGCGCRIRAKITLLNSTCPIGKW